MKVRENTNKLLEMVDDGLLDMRAVLVAALLWISEAEIRPMAESNEFFTEEEGDEE